MNQDSSNSHNPPPRTEFRRSTPAQSSTPNNVLAAQQTKKFGVGRRPLQYSTYAKLLEYFRASNVLATGQPNYSAAANATGCNYNTAKRAWETGWMDRSPPWHPIRDVLSQETQVAKTERSKALQVIAEQVAAAIEAAQADSVRVRKSEGLLLDGTRAVAGKLLTQVIQLCQVTDALTADLTQQMAEDYVGRDQFGVQKRTVMEKVEVIQRVAGLARQNVSLVESAFNLERKFMGQPDLVVATKTVESLGPDVTEMTSNAELVTELMNAAHSKRALLAYLKGSGALPAGADDALDVDIIDVLLPVAKEDASGEKGEG